MELFDMENIAEIDSQNMIEHINTLPDQLAAAWKMGQSFSLPEMPPFQQIVIAGMGGSAIAGDMIAAYAAQTAKTPVTVLRDYTLPHWENMLVICSSHSGNTEETLSVFEQAQAAGHAILAIATGGKLSQKAKEANIPLWTFEDDFQPRAAVGYSFGLLLAAFAKLGVLDSAKAQADLEATVAALKAQQTEFLPEVPTALNPAKRMAGQFINRWIVLFASGFLSPIARRWKTQINEVAKAQAAFEILPEANHNTLQGIYFPESMFSHSLAYFITSKKNHPRNQLREEETRKIMMLEGIATDFYRAPNLGVMEDMWAALHFGDYLAYYLAIAYQADPTPVPMLETFKQTLKDAG
ncbi:bifunctional phosphoglucose/phosphomannose isomerase [bacterium]|nr:bifunctional phosphoglucose/phosphomannose isomerase [bacterium]MCB2179291.1 bifunctional phosphoglucose/phosphomannose isomerase [bacterium]